MKLIATVSKWEDDPLDEFHQRNVETDVEFFDVKEFKIEHGFFMVYKNNGEVFAINRNEIIKFKLIN